MDNRIKLFWEFSRKRIMEGKKAEVKLPCLQFPLLPSSVLIAIRGPSLQPQLRLLGVVDRMTREPRLSSSQFCPEKKQLLLANPALIFPRD